MSNADIGVLIMLWIAWCAVHSGLISLTVTRYLHVRLGDRYRFYRLFYNVLAIISFLPLYLFTLNNIGEVVFSWQGGWQLLQYGLFAGAIFLFVLGALKYDLKTFLGIAQFSSKKNHTIMSDSGELDTSGVLGFTRHPWYLAALMLIWSWQKDIHLAKFLVNCVLTGYLVVGTLLEERKLRLELGQSYIDYSKEVSMLLPIKWLRGKLSKSGDFHK